jgi:hypothetical protein
VPVVRCDARDAQSVNLALVALVEHALVRRQRRRLFAT